MATVNEKAIIYDSTCPLCVWYTNKFVETGLLGPNGRISFNDLQEQVFIKKMDLHRSKHEIPLVDLTGGTTLYGLDSLVHLLNPKIPFLKTLMKIKPIYWLAKGLYYLVSYNRRVIAAGNGGDDGGGASNNFDCTPDFNLPFRALYILLVLFLSPFLFAQFTKILLAASDIAMCIHGLVIGSFFSVFILLASCLLFAPAKLKVECMGQLATVLLLGSLVLLPTLGLSLLLPFNLLPFIILNLLLSSWLMFKEGKRRVSLLTKPNQLAE